MPRTPIDYSNTIIYKLRHKEDYENNNIYVGHTTDFTKRKSNHKSRTTNTSDNNDKFPVYVCIRNNGGWNMWEMIQIEKYPCVDENEAKTRERYWIDYLKSCLNKQLPNRTQKEYREENYDKCVKDEKIWRENNKGKIYERDKKYREENKEKIYEMKKEWCEINKEKEAERKKNNYESNKEEIKKRTKEWYDTNKNEINSRRYVKITCECGEVISKNSLSGHLKTKKHQQIINDKK